MVQKSDFKSVNELPDETLAAILSDKHSGSEEILSQLNHHLAENYTDISTLNTVIPLIKEQTTDFECIQNYLREIENIVISGHGKLKDFYVIKESDLDNSLKIIAEKFLKILPQRSKIITISNSKTLASVFRILRKKNKEIDLIISESRPLLEGRIMAEETTSFGIHTTLITESDIANHLPGCDLAVIGADKILSNMSVVNKKGSNLLALLCKMFNIPLIVLSRKSKFSQDNKYIEVEKNKNEIWNSSNNLIEVKNFYFDVVQKELISNIITD